MSDLWMILVLLGVSIVLAVVVFNWWQEKKYRKDVEYRFSHTRTDVLDGEVSASSLKESPKKSQEKSSLSEEVEGWMSEPRVRQSPKFEPDFGKSTVPKNNSAVAQERVDLHPPIKEGQNSSSHLEPSLHLKQTPASYEAAGQTASVQTQQNQELPESLTIPASSAETVEPYQAAPVQNTQPLPDAVHTAMDWVGLIDAPLGVMLAELQEMQAEIRTFPQHTSLWAQASGETAWRNVLALDTAAMQDQKPMSLVVCALQLADRGGPVDAETLQRFQKSMETLARGLGLTVMWQGGYEPSGQAQAIDSFCIEVDKAVEFHVLANQGMFHATKLRGLAEACGMQLSAEGRFELLNAEGELEFSVRNYEGKPFSAEMLKTAVMTGVTFQLDIPTTPDSLLVFDRMVDIARSMANSLNAGLIDVNRKSIGEAQLDKIRQQLNHISNAMAVQGIVPGSSQAKRLFS